MKLKKYIRKRALLIPNLKMVLFNSKCKKCGIDIWFLVDDDPKSIHNDQILDLFYDITGKFNNGLFDILIIDYDGVDLRGREIIYRRDEE